MGTRRTRFPSRGGGSKVLKRLILVAAIAALSGCDSPADQAERAQILVQVDAHLALKNRLRDPDSADITDTRIDATNRIVCGAFRARNGFGGMAYLQNYI